jgi:hypothetical protein
MGSFLVLFLKRREGQKSTSFYLLPEPTPTTLFMVEWDVLSLCK